MLINTIQYKVGKISFREMMLSYLTPNDEKFLFVESYNYLGATPDNLLDFELHAKTTYTFKLVFHKIKIFSKI